MIETIGDLLKVLHHYPSATRLEIGFEGNRTSLLSGDVLNTGEGEIVLPIAPPPVRLAAPNSEVDDALDQCDRILEMCDEVPEKGEDFAESVKEKVESIADWIEKNGHVTPAQQTSLDNMERGVSRWVERD